MNKPVGPYTPAVRVGNLLVISGQIGLENGSLIVGGLKAELPQALLNLHNLLEQEGCLLTDVFKTTVFMTDINDYNQMNELYCKVFGDHRPARSAVAVSALPIGACVEIEAWASLIG